MVCAVFPHSVLNPVYVIAVTPPCHSVAAVTAWRRLRSWWTAERSSTGSKESVFKGGYRVMSWFFGVELYNKTLQTAPSTPERTAATRTPAAAAKTAAPVVDGVAVVDGGDDVHVFLPLTPLQFHLSFFIFHGTFEIVTSAFHISLSHSFLSLWTCSGFTCDNPGDHPCAIIPVR